MKEETNHAIFSATRLPVTGCYNLRDLGGYKTTDGRVVRFGALFRSDDLHTLTQDDMDYLSGIPIKTIVDFRSDEEVEMSPDKLPSSVSNYYHYGINPGNLNVSVLLNPFDGENAVKYMTDINEMLVSDADIIGRYKNFFSLLQQEEQMPLLFHCSAGKDRTGMGAALVLYALGVDEDTIFEDYLLSNKFLEGKYAAYLEQYPQLKSLLGVKKEYLRAGFLRIRQMYGSVENYLQKELEVDIHRLRLLYVEN